MKKRFSERQGLVVSPAAIQTDDINDALRNSIWNYVHDLFFNIKNSNWEVFPKWIARFFRKSPVDEVPDYYNACLKWTKSYFFSLSWGEIYEFVEFIVENYDGICKLRADDRPALEEIFNHIFEQELSGYRFIAGMIVPITNPAEIEEINNAIILASQAGMDGARQHIQSAIGLLAKRPDPDYRNSIKEAISAVESIAKVLGKNDSKGLADALDELSKKVEIHPALRAGFTKLYGYTSDADGIRHAILEEQNIGITEAQYMVISCSAFVNFLIVKAQEAGLVHVDKKEINSQP